jgi:hypothetical protein
MANAIEVPAEKIIAALQTLHGQHHQEWAFFTEVLLVGWEQRSYPRIDAIAVGGWRKNGYRVVAYEVKVTRSDWLRELKHPEKREPAEEVADECWFATAPGVIKDGEVPDGWGLLEVTSTGTRRTIRAAPHRRKTTRPDWFVASLARIIFDQKGPPLAPDDCVLWRVAASAKPLTKEQMLAVCKEMWGDVYEAARKSLWDDWERRDGANDTQAVQHLQRIRAAVAKAFPEVYYGSSVEQFCDRLDQHVAKVVAALEAMGGMEQVGIQLANRIALAQHALEELRGGAEADGEARETERDDVG